MQPALCPVGHYCPPGLTLGWEFPCPQGTVQNQLGASGPEACLLCPAGMKKIIISNKSLEVITTSRQCVSNCVLIVALLWWYSLQECSALSLVCPSRQVSVRQDTTVRLDPPALMPPSIRCSSFLLFSHCWCWSFRPVASSSLKISDYCWGHDLSSHIVPKHQESSVCPQECY